MLTKYPENKAFTVTTGLNINTIQLWIPQRPKQCKI